MKTLWRVVAVIIGAVIAACLIVPRFSPAFGYTSAFVLRGGPIGTPRIVVARVLPWAHTTVRPGDIVLGDDWGWVDAIRYRRAVTTDPYRMPVMRDGHRIVADVTPVLRETTRTPLPVLVPAAFGLLIALILAWRRPSFGTVLLLYGIAAGATPGQDAAAALARLASDPAVASFIYRLLTFALVVMPSAGLVGFLALYPRGSRATIASAAAVTAGLATVEFVQAFVAPLLYTNVDFFVGESTAATAVVFFFGVWSYRRADGPERQRAGWLLAGVTFSIIGIASSDIASFVAPTTAIATLFQFVSLGTPLCFAYAILRHRVLDISFALNRTAVFATLTALVVATIGFTDWLAGKVLSGSGLTATADALVTIAIGFALNSVHARVERVVDRLVFRSRYVAEKRIESRIDSLAYARGEAAVEATLAEGSAMLGLSWSAVYRASPEGYVRSASSGVGSAPHGFAEDDVLVRTLAARRNPFVLADFAIAIGELGNAIAIPMLDGRDLTGFSLYGSRADETLPDPEEIALLTRLNAAGARALLKSELLRFRRGERTEGELRV